MKRKVYGLILIKCLFLTRFEAERPADVVGPFCGRFGPVAGPRVATPRFAELHELYAEKK